MALQTSGAISLNEIHIEAGGSSGSQATLNDSDIRALIGKSSGAQMSFSEWYGATAETDLTSGGTVNGEAQRQEITVSSFISSGGTLVIPSSIWVWSDDVATAALTIDIPCTIKNYGKIIGRGGNGGYSFAEPAGGPAIKINSSISGVTIYNYSGAYIAGGGGGGGRGRGGGGAGGGGYTDYGFGGGQLNAVGADGGPGAPSNYGKGGGAGGGGGGAYTAWYSYDHYGGAGGRILPGTGGAGGSSQRSGGAGGSAGNAGGNGTGSGNSGGGGGGWGAYGGNGTEPNPAGGAGGKAIDDSGNSYTLSNSGTIYGGT